MRAFFYITFFVFCSYSGAQTDGYYNLKITYEIHGLGSNLGDSNRVFTLNGNKVSFEIPYSIHEIDLVEKDTLGLEYYSGDSVFYIFPEFHLATLNNSSIDSIYKIMYAAEGKGLGGTNPCIRSGSAHYMYLSADSIGSRHIQMYNTFDSTALTITNIIIANLDKNFVEFRPLDKWENAKKCHKHWKERTQRFEGMSREGIRKTPEESERENENGRDAQRSNRTYQKDRE